MKKLIRITTAPISLKILLKGQLSFMRNYYDVKAISSPGEDLLDVSKNEGITVFPVAMERKISFFKDCKSVLSLYKIFIKEKPFIVHTHTPKAGAVGMLAAWLAGVPHRLHTVAGLPLMESKGKIRKILILVEKYTYKFATKIYPNSKGLMDFIILNKLCPVNKLKILGNGSSNGINTDYFNNHTVSSEQCAILKKELNIEEDHFVFLFVGRLVKDKGINELVDVFINIYKKYPHTRLLLVGDFEKTRDPIDEDKEKEIHNHPAIIYTGHQEDVRPYYAISSVLVFPSYREGFPNVVMQAGSMGLASIVTNINGCNEIIIEGKNGYLISTKNKEHLYSKMEMYLTNYNLLSEHSSNAREMIITRFQQQVIWEALLEEYKYLENSTDYVSISVQTSY